MLQKELTITYTSEHSETRDDKIIVFVREEFGLELCSSGHDLRTSERTMKFNDEELGNAT